MVVATIDSTTGPKAATCEVTNSELSLFILAQTHNKRLIYANTQDRRRLPHLRKGSEPLLLEARVIKELYKIALGFMHRADFVEIASELVFPLKPNHQLAHLSQETNGLAVCVVVLSAQRGFDLTLINRQRLFWMLFFPFRRKSQPQVIRAAAFLGLTPGRFFIFLPKEYPDELRMVRLVIPGPPISLVPVLCSGDCAAQVVERLLPP